MGIGKTVILPAGLRAGVTPGTGNDAAVDFVHAHPNNYLFFANEQPDKPGPKAGEVYKMGAI